MNPQAANVRISHNLRECRKRAGLSQQQVTARLQTMGFNYGRGRLSMIETQKRPAPAPLLAALRLIYGCAYADIFHGVEDCFDNQ